MSNNDNMYNVVPTPAQGGPGLAIASMVLGICGVVFGCCFYWLAFILGVIGLILGAVALAKKTRGRGMAIAGLVLSIITIAFGVIGLVCGAALYSEVMGQSAMNSLS